MAYGGSAASIQGAVRLNAASPYIHNSTIRHNANGGIYAYNNSAPRIEGNTVTDNRTTQERGGGIYVSGRAKVIGNTIRNNTVDRSACCNEGYGGGLYATNGAEVRANTIVNNTLTAYYRTYGGGLHVDGGTVTDNIITGNAIGPSNCGCGHARGGGLYANNSTVSGNTTTAQDSVAGGGLYASGSTVSGNTVADNTSTANNTDVWGGGIWATNSNLSNNVVSGNISVADDSVYGGAVHQQNGNFTGNTVVVSNQLSVVSSARQPSDSLRLTADC
ncbi:MAG: right-handed parallel beta-helix repeat-containing protein [Chloroflexi bacterium]|nr:right-handed parallel beta-helix repeat-containing protein [Chloroflexota bacterium]